MKKLSLVAILLLIATGVFAQEKWIPVTYNVSFKIKNAGITVSGKFQGFRGTLLFSPDKLSASSLTATVDVATLTTGIGKRDEDLKEEKYFDADKYKQIEIKSVKLYQKGAQYAGMFKVTIKGVTKEMEIPFEFDQLGTEADFKGSLVIKRSDFGIGGKTLTMSDEASVSIAIKAKK